MRALISVFAALVLAVAGAAPAVAGPTKERGMFVTLPDGAAIGLEVEGIAVITRSDAGRR